MRKLRKGAVAKGGAFVFVIALTFLIAGGMSQASGTGNEPFLGDCMEYGIVCNFLNQRADMETNFASGKYQGNGHTIGNTVSEDKANAAGVIKVGEVVGKMKVRGNPVVIQDESVKAEVKEMIAKTKSYSESVIKKSNLLAPDVKDMNNYVIDAAGVDSKVVYVDADKVISAINSGTLQNGAMKLHMREEQTVVFNTKEENKITIPRYSVKVTEGKKSNEEIAQTVIWNMPKVGNLAIESDGLRATIIAPTALVNINTTGEGWLVCDQVVSNSGEWHMIYKKIKTPTPTPEPTKTPKPTPKVTPTPEPTEKPTPTPEITPTPEPTEEPTPTPEITPTPAPTEKPTPTPEVTPTPEPTEKPTPTPEITPTPEPTEKPTPTPEITPTPEPTEKPTPTPEITPTPAPTEEPTPTPEVTPGPDETPAPTEPVVTPDVPDVPKASIAPTSTPPITTVVEEDVPKAAAKSNDKKIKKSKAVTVLDEDVPLSDSAPETGDTTNLFIPILGMGFSALAMLAVFVYRRRRS